MVIVPTKKRSTQLKKRRQVTWDIRKGGSNTVRGRKAKGRAAVVEVCQLILDAFPTLQMEDVFVKATSQGGCDVHLSPKALKKFPYGIEVKCQESLNIWSMLAQAENNAKDLIPISFFKRSRTPLFVVLRAEKFMELVKEK